MAGQLHVLLHVAVQSGGPRGSSTQGSREHTITEQEVCLFSSSLFSIALKMVASFYSDDTPFQSEHTAHMHTNDGKRNVNSV